MKRILVDATHSEEIRVAVLNDETLVDFEVEREGQERTRGNIYKGQVAYARDDIGAVFVECGLERPGMLSLNNRAAGTNWSATDAAIAESDVEVGQEILVQVGKEARGGNKGATLTADISLVGHFMILKPLTNSSGVSQSIREPVRSQIRKQMDSLEVPKGMGVVVRTAANGKSADQMQNDVDTLVRLWHRIKSASGNAKPPRLMYQESNLAHRMLRDVLNDEVGEVLVDGPDIYTDLEEFAKQVFPQYADRVKRWEDRIPVFTKFNIEHLVQKAYQRTVNLKSGGSIVIDPTEALVAIDVNSARAKSSRSIKETALKTNQEAADEIARQLRLRDIGGLIVVDFIDMDTEEDRQTIEKRMDGLLAHDKATTTYTHLSSMGLMEIQRQRIRPSLYDIAFSTCPHCGRGLIRDTTSLALSILRAIEANAADPNKVSVQVDASTDVVTYLMNEKRADISLIEDRTGKPVMVVAHPDIDSPKYSVRGLTEKEASSVRHRASFELRPPTQFTHGFPEHRPKKQLAGSKPAVTLTPDDQVATPPSGRAKPPRSAKSTGKKKKSGKKSSRGRTERGWVSHLFSRLFDFSEETQQKAKSGKKRKRKSRSPDQKARQKDRPQQRNKDAKKRTAKSPKAEADRPKKATREGRQKPAANRQSARDRNSPPATPKTPRSPSASSDRESKSGSSQRSRNRQRTSQKTSGQPAAQQQRQTRSQDGDKAGANAQKRRTSEKETTPERKDRKAPTAAAKQEPSKGQSGGRAGNDPRDRQRSKPKPAATVVEPPDPHISRLMDAGLGSANQEQPTDRGHTPDSSGSANSQDDASKPSPAVTLTDSVDSSKNEVQVEKTTDHAQADTGSKQAQPNPTSDRASNDPRAARRDSQSSTVESEPEQLSSS